MSKIGRKPIDLGSVTVELNGQNIDYKGKKVSGSYALPEALQAQVTDNKLQLVVNHAKLDRKMSRDINRIWGLHRALLANQLKGANQEFERKLEINGLGFKAALAGSKATFTLGYTHKIEYDLPKEVSMEIDRTGQKLTLKSYNKELLGHVCSQIRAMRKPEPYKGTGIKYAEEVIVRKAGKTKAS